MQEGCPDYYEEEIEGKEMGCCLNCDDAEEGCLCTNCKCKKCYWYCPSEDNYQEGNIKGRCDLVPILKDKEWYDKIKKAKIHLGWRKCLCPGCNYKEEISIVYGCKSRKSTVCPKCGWELLKDFLGEKTGGKDAI